MQKRSMGTQHKEFVVEEQHRCKSDVLDYKKTTYQPNRFAIVTSIELSHFTNVTVTATLMPKYAENSIP